MSKKCRECGNTEFKMTRYYSNECIVDIDDRDISVSGLKGCTEMDSERVCTKCGKIKQVEIRCGCGRLATQKNIRWIDDNTAIDVLICEWCGSVYDEEDWKVIIT